MPTSDINVANDQMVSVGPNRVQVLIPKVAMSPDEALTHAAWLVALAEHNATHTFQEVYEAVCNT